MAALGWQAYFQEQRSLDEQDGAIPARIIEQCRTAITVMTESKKFDIATMPGMPEMVVGDWVLLNNNLEFLCLLQR